MSEDRRWKHVSIIFRLNGSFAVELQAVRAGRRTPKTRANPQSLGDSTRASTQLLPFQ
jgi:hypothetical protein